MLGISVGWITPESKAKKITFLSELFQDKNKSFKGKFNVV